MIIFLPILSGGLNFYKNYHFELTDEFSFTFQALAGEVGMDNELDEVANALYNGQLPNSWRKLAPATLKTLGGWMEHFIKRHIQYFNWVSSVKLGARKCRGKLSFIDPQFLQKWI